MRRHDLARQRIMEAVEMPDRVAENLVMFIRQNNGALSKNRREGAFKQLTDDEVQRIERIVADAFEGPRDLTGSASSCHGVPIPQQRGGSTCPPEEPS